MLVRRHLRQGFILLWTLALLMLMAVVLSVLARSSARKAAEAVDAQEQLQRKWAIASCRHVLLHDAEHILSQAERRGQSPVASVCFTQSLGDLQLEVKVADEQAKVNLTTAYQQVGEERTISLAHTLLRNAPPSLEVVLQPDPRAPRPKPQSPAATQPNAPVKAPDVSAIPSFGCWSQVFEPDNPRALFGASIDAPSAIDGLTCWGDGRLNLRRAAPEAALSFLELFLQPVDAHRLLEARAQHPMDKPDTWLTAAEITGKSRAEVASRITTGSACYSVVVHISGRGRDWYEMAVLENKTETPPESVSPATQESSTPAGPQKPPESGTVRRLIW